MARKEKNEEARRAILREWDAWSKTSQVGTLQGMAFFNHLQEDRRICSISSLGPPISGRPFTDGCYGRAGLKIEYRPAGGAARISSQRGLI